jgi:hypothetical protein
MCQVPVAHACNHSYSGGRDQKENGSKPAQANSSRDPISRNPSQKRAGGVAQGVGPEFKLQYCKRKKKRAYECSLQLLLLSIFFHVSKELVLQLKSPDHEKPHLDLKEECYGLNMANLLQSSC